MTTYVDYLGATGHPVYRGGGTSWRLYKGALVTAQAYPEFPTIGEREAHLLLKESGGKLITWSSEPGSRSGPWWWTVCETYNRDSLSGKVRNQIRRGHRNCHVDRVTAQWVADNGYECYRRAFTRYRHSVPVHRDAFARDNLITLGYESVFHFWAVFRSGQLAGYARCIVEQGRGVSISSLRYDPEHLDSYAGYALLDRILQYYVSERGLSVSNGPRPILHDTAIQNHLLKFGFRRQHCRLNVVYDPILSAGISVAYPFRNIIKSLDFVRPLHYASSLLRQEEIRREYEMGPRRAYPRDES